MVVNVYARDDLALFDGFLRSKDVERVNSSHSVHINVPPLMVKYRNPRQKCYSLKTNNFKINFVNDILVSIFCQGCDWYEICFHWCNGLTLNRYSSKPWDPVQGRIYESLWGNRLTQIQQHIWECEVKPISDFRICQPFLSKKFNKKQYSLYRIILFKLQWFNVHLCGKTVMRRVSIKCGSPFTSRTDGLQKSSWWKYGCRTIEICNTQSRA